MTESDFQKGVIELAHALGWRVAHFRPAQTTKGWRTPVAADGAGWPDLVLCHPMRGLLFRELKSDTGSLSPEQAEWIALLQLAGADAGVWHPHELGRRIIQELGGRRDTPRVRHIA